MEMPVPKINENPGKQPTHCHSRYRPEAEAHRYLESSIGGSKPALVFILGAGRNFLGKAIRSTLPGTMVVVLQVCTDFDDSLVDPGDLYWNPESPYPLEKTLASAFSSGKAAGGIALIEWPPATRGYRTVLESIRTRLQQALELYSTESATSAYWGRRWVKNSIDFVCGEGPLALPARGSAPVVIACAGPGLHEALPAIREAGRNIRLWALSSAHQALIHAGLEPELVLGTDPGFWNGTHLSLAARRNSLLAVTPSTKLGTAILDGGCSIVPVCTGLGFEYDALAAAGDIPAIEASASGTAAGTALSVATGLNTGPVYLCGLDLAAHGLAEHASPYAFDVLDELIASRLRPALASRFSRVMERYPESRGPWRFSRAFSAYAMETASSTNRTNLFRISSSPVDTHIERVNPDHLLSTRVEGMTMTYTKAEVHIFHRKLTRKARLEAMIDRLTRRSRLALARLRECAGTGLPVPRETVLELFAFGGKGCAAAIARAARGEVSPQEILEAEKAVKTGLRFLAGGTP